MPKIINPYNSDIVEEYEYTPLSQVEARIEKLLKYQYPEFKTRIANLSKLLNLLSSSGEVIAKLITLETGKTITESRGEVQRALITITKTIEIADHLETTSHIVEDSSSSFKTSMTKRYPYGIILCITPFNFPLNLALHKLAPAYLGGNSILLKPAECNFKSMSLFIELCHKAGMGDAIELVIPAAKDMNTLTSDKRVKIISFTGGTEVANIIAKNAGRKKLLFELGGNAPLIIYPDCDLDKAVDTAIAGRFFLAGQKCTSNKRVFLHQDIYEEFKNKLINKTKKLIVGDPLDESTQVGPVISHSACEKLKTSLAELKKEGVKTLLGGDSKGNLFEPTILEGFEDNSIIHKVELFGPVLPLFSFRSDDEVISLVNSSPYGLQAGVFTSDLNKIKKFFHQLEVGSVMINEGPGFRLEHLPFGGIKDSGEGREGIKYAYEEMTFIKQLIF